MQYHEERPTKAKHPLTHLAQVGVELNCSCVRVQSISVLVQLVIQHPQRTPYVRVVWVAVPVFRSKAKQARDEMKKHTHAWELKRREGAPKVWGRVGSTKSRDRRMNETKDKRGRDRGPSTFDRLIFLGRWPSDIIQMIFEGASRGGHKIHHVPGG